ncbi:glycoside hydrolase family 88 protein [Flavobacterium agrisoli]|uniref:Glycoside hydrolase family 88 protein n=1 Tax=Flavobacterium agrisoli TaxID=2793066 RepID=A0A934PNK6_9FLAO|nr:glycoside hydrolase family 88 protein [Flavobacterium agrisoli]MBK0370208.1 glycoside hydrolase family 88 protein [Flavobacterium agrisoli]
MKAIGILTFLLMVMGNPVLAQKKKKELVQLIETTLQKSVTQYQYLATQVEPGHYPKTWQEKQQKLETSSSGWWCSGFYPGTLLYLQEYNPQANLKIEATSFLEDLKKEQFNTTTHDLGFMMYCSFGNALRLFPNPSYEAILLQSAKSLSTRYRPVAQCIQSWDSAAWNKASKDEIPVIIDNMMNLELLFWASKYSGDPQYRNIAIAHANTTMKNHFRPDYSSYHEIVYSLTNGKVVKKITNQGAADESSWARGQAWGLYGFVVMYRETKETSYLKQAQHIAQYILHYPNMSKDLIPYWDYQAEGIPDALKDSSAAAITASALLELATFSADKRAKEYQKAAEIILKTLCSAAYFSAPQSNGGFLLKHGVGNYPKKTEIDGSLSYGDYYFVEAMMRYLKM